MKYLLSFLLASHAWCESTPICPPESFPVEYVSPVSKGKVSFCAYQKDVVTIKHGEEILYDAKGEVKKRTSFTHGQESTRPAQLPGAEETKDFINGLVGTRNSVMELMQILNIHKSVERGKFKVSGCDKKPRDWVMAALMKTEVKKSYAYDDRCDVAGSFKANFIEDFPVSFNLRNLDNYTSVNMQVKMSLDKSVKGILYRFEVKEGLLKSPAEKVKFLAQYEVEIDLRTGEAYPNTQKGKLTIINVNDKPVNESTDMTFNYK